MILNYEINAELSINSLMDLNKLKTLEETGSMKINASELARHLDVDRRTIRKYINGFEKKPTRNRSTQFDEYYVTIKSLLNHDVKIFHYKSFLYRYLIDKYGMKGAESSFRRYINSIDEFKAYFADKRKKGTKQPSIMRYETSQGQ